MLNLNTIGNKVPTQIVIEGIITDAHVEDKLVNATAFFNNAAEVYEIHNSNDELVRIISTYGLDNIVKPEGIYVSHLSFILLAEIIMESNDTIIRDVVNDIFNSPEETMDKDEVNYNILTIAKIDSVSFNKIVGKTYNASNKIAYDATKMFYPV